MANYYEILGVSKDATQDEIKTAYRKLVKQYHPDLHPNDPACAAKFKEINEANETLSDPQKRKKYDFEQEHPGMGGFGGFGGGAYESTGGFGGFDDIFGDIFSQFTGGGARASQEVNRKGQDISLEVELSFLDAAKGCTKEVSYNRNEPCKTCRGTGAKNGSSYSTCYTCKGKGQIQYVSGGGFFQSISVRPCTDCNGTGKRILEKCPDCSGRGYNKTKTTVSFDIPAGADTNSYIRKRGYGDASKTGGEAGDLIVVFKVLPHKIFKRKNYDLYLELPIPFKLATLGGKVKIPTLDDTIEITIPECTQSGKTFTVKGKGIRSRMGFGDLFVTVTVEVPDRLNKDARKALEKFDDALNIKQYEKIRKFNEDMSSLYGVDYLKGDEKKKK